MITAKYFTHTGISAPEKKLAEIAARTGFRAGREIFRGQIYDRDKVGSLIYQGWWRNKPAVLKIQGLRPEVDEIDIINRFNKQNKSRSVRLPLLYGGLKWNKKTGYGYLLLEHIDAPKIYQPPFANRSQIKDFCRLYQEYKSRCLKKPLFKKEPAERNSAVFIMQRLAHWRKVAESKGITTKNTEDIISRFQSLVRRHMPTIKMEFMHGHFTYDDIYKISGNKYVLMSNLFWSYRPEYYDAVFHLWAGLKSIRDLKITLKKVIGYLNKWLVEYKKMPVIKNDADFERKFYLMMTERCVGTLLVDIQNQHYDSNRAKQIKHLTKLFGDLFIYSCDQLDNKKHYK